MTETKSYDITMQYDDMLTLEDLGAQGQVTVTNGKATSFQVGTEAPDEAVVTYTEGKLYATGIGTATVKIGEEEYQFTVEPAPISLLMITGSSSGVGEKGDAGQSLRLREGSAYSSHEGNSVRCLSASDENVTYGLGAFCENRAKSVAEMTTGDGVIGISSAFSYAWTQKTGEKLWLLDAAKGGSNLGDWTTDGVLYPHAVKLFQTAARILNDEVQAGHYRLTHMGIINYTCSNGDQKWERQVFREALLGFWENMKRDLTCTIGGETRTVEAMGLVMPYTVASMGWKKYYDTPFAMNNGKVECYSITADAAYPDIYMAGTENRNFLTDESVEAFFENEDLTYETHGTPVQRPYDRQHTYADGTHLSQVGYNAFGRIIGGNAYAYFYEKPEAAQVKLLAYDGVTEIGDSYSPMHFADIYLIPDCKPTSVSDLTVETSDGLTYDHGMLTGEKGTTGTVTVKQQGKAVRTVQITIK